MTLASRPASPRWTATVETDRPLAWVCMTRRPSRIALALTIDLSNTHEHWLPVRHGTSLAPRGDDLKRISLSSRRSRGRWTGHRAGRDDGAVSSFEIAGVQVSIDDETLREVVSDPSALAAWCLLNPEDPRTVAGLRMLGRLDEAADAGRRSLEAEGLSPVMRAVRRARFAQVLQWQGDFTAAEEQLDLAAEETGMEDPTSTSSLTVLAAVFQHRAKCRFDHAQRELSRGQRIAAARLRQDALEDARRSLLMRERLGATDDGTLESSRQTLARLERGDPTG